MTTDSKAVCGGGEDLQQALSKLYRHALNCPGAEYDGDAIESANRVLSAALASTAGAGAWRPMNTAPSDTPIVARHKPNSRTPHGWVATISRAPEDPDERVGGLDTILHYNGNALMRGFHGVWVGWMYPEEFAALALSAGTLSVGWDGARDAFARIVEDRAWTAEHGEPRAACLRAASDIRQAKAPAVPASPRSGAGEGEDRSLFSDAIEIITTIKANQEDETGEEDEVLACLLERFEAAKKASALSQGGGAGRSEKGEGGGPHRILEAANTLNGEWALTIAWPDRTETVEIVGDNAAAALGYVPEGDDA